MLGGTGDDTYAVNSASDQVVEDANAGIDRVQSSVGYELAANVEHLTLTGAGNAAGLGNELANQILGNTGNNQLRGGDGNDSLNGGAGIDTLIGGAGDDFYLVDDAGDVVTEGVGGTGTADTVQSTVSYVLAAPIEHLILAGTAASGTGNSSGNMITGNNVANTLTGNGGEDTLDGGGGFDVLIGGSGADTYIVDAQGESVQENPGEGIDLVRIAVSYSLGANLEHLTLTGSANANGTGNGLNNAITGNEGVNQLRGNDGNDTLDGGLGADIMVGGIGGDLYVVDNAADSVSDGVGGTGVDTVHSTIDYALGGPIEHLTLFGPAINGTGNSLANTITGNALANNLSGLGGSDTLNGRGGADTLAGGAARDRFVFMAGEADGDTVLDFNGQGALAGDDILFQGFGAGATFVQTSATTWNITYNGGASIETLTFSNGALIHASDYTFA